MRVLVTGASGFVGSSLVRHLLSRGHSVVAIHRRNETPRILSDMRENFPGALEIRSFDLSFSGSLPNLKSKVFRKWISEAHECIPSWHPDYPVREEDLRSAEDLLSGSDICVHCASKVEDWGSLESFFLSNVNSTRVLQEASRRVGHERFILLSSVSVHGFGKHRQSTENGPFFPLSNPYPLSKRLAESLVQESPTVIIRPGNVYGPGDTTVLYHMFREAERGIMGTVSKGRALTCPVYIEDLCAAILLSLSFALPEDRSGRTFNIVGEGEPDWHEFVQETWASLGIQKKWPDLPAWLVRIAAVLLETSFRLVHSKTAPILSRFRIEHVAHDFNFSYAHAEKILSYRPMTGLKEGLAASVRAYRSKD